MPAPRKPRVTVSKILRLLLADDAETWELAKWAESQWTEDGILSRLKIALNLYRRAQFDMVAMKEMLDRTEGKLAPAYTLPDEEGDVRIVQPVLYVEPDDPAVKARLFQVVEVANEGRPN